MYLKALEIQGFKSFPEKTLITFGEELTAIVGPNGSGKSNLSDAIRWVMGEQSTKALRGGKMEDIIFGGTQTRKQQGFAEVSLVLDNTARRIDREESELMVTRRYYRSGESEYYINRHAVRLKDVNELFMDTGLGREGYSIIGQGKIDEILSVKSADRREIFEEAAGISRYRHRKEEAERRLERTEENLVRVSDKISELELQVEPLRHQAEKAKRYLILRDELRLLEISVWMDQLDQIRANTVRLNSDYDGAVRRKTQTQQEVEALYRDAEAYTVQMREKDTAAERIRFEMMQRQADANELENTAAVYRANLQNNLENKIRVQQELDRQTGRAGSLEAQMQQQRGRLEALLCEIQTRTQCRAEKENQARQAARSAEAVLGEIDALRTKETLETASAAEAKALLSALAAAAQEVLDRDAALRQTLLEEERQREAQEGEQAAAQAALKEAKAQQVALGNTVSGYALRLEQRRQRVQAGTDRHMKLQMEEHALQSRLQMLSEMETLYEGYSKAVKLVMGEAKRGRLKGICGPVAGLIQVPDAYAVAIETAL
ncbi:MAG: AAA family ATPase, partial [Oscillospiraceae bacterium]|nr:AAA family ATPase [Oscillospiraceae bacterium]